MNDDYEILLESIANTIKDYRAGEIPEPTKEHVLKWVEQFTGCERFSILKEMNHILKQTYFSKKAIENFFQLLIVSPKLVGDDPITFWKNIEILNIQKEGNSQRDMNAMLDSALKNKFELEINECELKTREYIYLDDGLYTGSTIRREISEWIKNDAPAIAKLHIIVIALHEGGRRYTMQILQNMAGSVGKQIDIRCLGLIHLEDSKNETGNSDVLRPVEIPEDPQVKEYVQKMKHEPFLRKGSSIGKNKFFSSDASRRLLETEFLIAGAKIREICPNLGDTQRPLGHHSLEMLGFGSLIATFRNCPNNAPLALWVDYPWYPLFPRKTNTQTKTNRLFEELFS